MLRRDLLKLAGLLPAQFALNRLSRAASLAQPKDGSCKLLTVFLRGGMDGLNALVPHFDPGYAMARPGLGQTIGSSPSDSLPLANLGGYVHLHPSLGGLQGLYNSDRVAFMHRIGNDESERSHFTEMHLVETAAKEYRAISGGWPMAMVDGLGVGADPFAAMSLTRRLQRLYLGTGSTIASHFGQPYTDQMGAGTKLRTVNLSDTASRNRIRTDMVQHLATVSGSTTDSNLRSTMEVAFEAAEAMPASYAHSVAYDLPSGLSDDSYYFANRVEDAVQLLSNPATDATCIGVELGGFDTHQAQDASLAMRLAVLDAVLTAAHNQLEGTVGAAGGKFVILVVSEFGRTVDENTASGTDHGMGGVYMALGNAVRGGVYNMLPVSPMDPIPVNARLFGSRWKALADTSPSLNPSVTGSFRDVVVPATDFRVPFLEIAKDLFQLTGPQIAGFPLIGPEWQAIDSNPQNPSNPAHNPLYKKLGFLL